MNARNRAARILPDSRSFAYTVIAGVFIIFAAVIALLFLIGITSNASASTSV